jgi:valyl-tRNA synthetase
MTKIWNAFRLINMWNHEDKPANNATEIRQSNGLKIN